MRRMPARPAGARLAVVVSDLDLDFDRRHGLDHQQWHLYHRAQLHQTLDLRRTVEVDRQYP